MFEDDDFEAPDYWNFDDCSGCKNNMKPRLCAECHNGEFYEEPDIEGLDSIFKD